MQKRISAGKVALTWDSYEGKAVFVFDGNRFEFDGELLIDLHEWAIMFAATSVIE